MRNDHSINSRQNEVVYIVEITIQQNHDKKTSRCMLSLMHHFYLFAGVVLSGTVVLPVAVNDYNETHRTIKVTSFVVNL